MTWQLKPRTEKTPCSPWSYFKDPLDDLSKCQKRYGNLDCCPSLTGFLFQFMRLAMWPQAQSGQTQWDPHIQEFVAPPSVYINKLLNWGQYYRALMEGEEQEEEEDGEEDYGISGG